MASIYYIYDPATSNVEVPHLLSRTRPLRQFGPISVLVPYPCSFSVMKYKNLEDEGTLRGKLHKFNIHSIRKKGDRFAGYLKILTGVESQVRHSGA